MRAFIFIAFLIIAASADAQIYMPGSFVDNSCRGSLLNNNLKDSAFKKKWFVSKYSGISTSLSFFSGGNAAIVSIPIGVQLNRRLNNNLFAFAGVSAVPAYINFNSSFLNTNFNKLNTANSFKSGTLGIYSRAELGLQYINDDRTFSISGSIGVERSSFPMPMYSPLYNKQNQNVSLKR